MVSIESKTLTVEVEKKIIVIIDGGRGPKGLDNDSAILIKDVGIDLQTIIDDNVGTKIIFGNSINDIFLLSDSLKIPSNSIIEINGTLKKVDSPARLLTANLGNSNTIMVANADQYFKAGQRIVVTDDSLPINGGGAYKTRKVGLTNVIQSVTSTSIVCTNSFSNWINGTGVTTAQNARVGLAHSVIEILPFSSNISIKGNGIIDGNLAKSLNIAGANYNRYAEDVQSSCGIVINQSSNVKIEGVTIKNCVLHGITTNIIVLGVTASSGIRINNITVNGCVDKSILGVFANEVNINNSKIMNGVDEGEIALYTSCVRWNIDNCYFFNNRRYGLVLVSSDNSLVNISNCIFNSSIEMVADMYIQDQSKGVNISNCEFTGNGTVSASLIIVNSKGILFNNISYYNRNVVTGSTISITSTCQGIVFNGLYALSSQVPINSAAAFFTCEGVNVNVNGFRFDTGNAAIRLSSTSKNITFENGQIVGFTRLFAVFHSTLSDYNLVNIDGVFKVENSGTVIIPSGETFVAISHGLSITPDPRNIIINPLSMGNAKAFWISDIQSSGFVINVDVDPGEDISFAWKIQTHKAPKYVQPTYALSYQSNFGSGVDGWTTGLATNVGNQDAIGGKDDNMLYWCNSTNSTHFAAKVGLSTTLKNRVSFEFYIPSTNTNLRGFKFYSGIFVALLFNIPTPEFNKWNIFVSDEFLSTSNTLMILFTNYANGNNWAGANLSTDDQFYIRNVKIENY